MILTTCLVKACLLHVSAASESPADFSNQTNHHRHVFCYWSVSKWRIFFYPALVNTLLPAFFFTKNLIHWLLFIKHKFSWHSSAALWLCATSKQSTDSLKMPKKRGSESELRAKHRGVFAPRPAVRVCLSNNAFLRIWKHEYDNWNWVSAVHSQLCRALEEQKKTVWKQTLKKRLGMNFNTTCSLKTWRNYPATLNRRRFFLRRRCHHSAWEHQGVSGGLGEGHEPWLSKLAALPGHCRKRHHKTKPTC